MMDRRAALRLGAAGVLAGPAVLVAFARDASAQAELPAGAVGVLNFALTLEHLEAEFYAQGLATPGLIPDRDRPIFEVLADHEKTHVAFLSDALGDRAEPKPSFDFTAGGAFDTFDDYEIFRLLSVAFEDTGVRAYKGQAIAEAAGELLESPRLLTQALTIHSVEARHAARVRQLLGYPAWVPGAFEAAPGAVERVYQTDGSLAADEPSFDVITSAVFGVDLLPLYDGPAERITEAFDEPLGMAAVMRIASSFIEVR